MQNPLVITDCRTFYVRLSYTYIVCSPFFFFPLSFCIIPDYAHKLYTPSFKSLGFIRWEENLDFFVRKIFEWIFRWFIFISNKNKSLPSNSNLSLCILFKSLYYYIKNYNCYFIFIWNFTILIIVCILK